MPYASGSTFSTCPHERPLQDLLPFSRRFPSCGCRFLCEETVGSLQPGGPTFGSRKPLREEINIRASDRTPVCQDILTHQCPYMYRDCTDMLCQCSWAGEGTLASSRFPCGVSLQLPQHRELAPLSFSGFLC